MKVVLKRRESKLEHKIERKKEEKRSEKSWQQRVGNKKWDLYEADSDRLVCVRWPPTNPDNQK